tara:strand:- start:241 stop:492 length:252 start_codon:yes stop_codon:yes gene_type:complete
MKKVKKIKVKGKEKIPFFKMVFADKTRIILFFVFIMTLIVHISSVSYTAITGDVTLMQTSISATSTLTEMVVAFYFGRMTRGE